MNWRSIPAYAAFYATRRDVMENYADLRDIASQSQSYVSRLQDDRLENLLTHAYQTVPYYRETLNESGVVDQNGVDIGRFDEIPLLTKEVLRNDQRELWSNDPREGIITDTSGGTTGEPVKFAQDSVYLSWNRANKLYYHDLAGRDLGEPWIKLWGDESDVFDERQGIKSRLADFVLNRHTLNSFRMGETEMTEYVGQINDIQPKSMEVYVESIDELAKHIENQGLNVYSPHGILSTAGTLHPPVRERVENVFDTVVLNKYGSREVGDIACECPYQEGLHIFDHTHFVEVVDEDGSPLPPGEEGEIAVTVLTNYTMPLIRYRIGDMGIMKEGQCSCGRPFSMLKEVTGRVSEHFRTADGQLIHGELFTHLLYHRSWIKKFQVRQTDRDHVLYRIVLDEEQSPPQSELDEIGSKTREALGEGVTVEFEFPEVIEPSKSGKYQYTISEVV